VFFGQNGFARPIDSVIQTIKISLFLVFDYLLFSYVPDQVSLPIAFGFSTFFIYFPFLFIYDLKNRFLPIFLLSLGSAIISSLISVISVFTNPPIHPIGFFSLSCIFIWNVLFPY
jgi:hypothetical protein